MKSKVKFRRGTVTLKVEVDLSTFPQFKPQLYLRDLKDEEYVRAHSPPEQQEVELKKMTPINISLYDISEYGQRVIDWTLDVINNRLKLKGIEVFRSDIPNPFDRTKQDERKLFELAQALYKKQIKFRKSYSYKASLEEANLKHRIIDKNDFDLRFENINRNYTNWRKRRKVNRIT